MSYQDRICTADDAAAIEAGFRVGEPLAKNPWCPACKLCNALLFRNGRRQCRSCGLYYAVVDNKISDVGYVMAANSETEAYLTKIIVANGRRG